jgi:hypothetical protein
MDPTVDEYDEPDPDFPSLPKRLLYVFVSPGKLSEFLAEDPKWIAALMASAAVIGVSMLLIPVEVFLDAQRQAALGRGVDFPDMPDRMVNAMRYVFPSIAVVSTIVFAFIFAGFYTLVFAFILGDEGRFKQYLAVLVHSWFIAALFGLLLTPLRLSTGDPQFTLNVASFFFFLPDGYLLNVFRALDLSQIWSTLVFAQGAHAIDKRRSFGSAAAIGLTITLGIALVAARFM